MRENLEAVNRQKKTLQGELTTLHEQAEKAGADAVQEFKVSLSFIDSCADYYDTGFDDCLRQVMSAFPKLDLSGITMDKFVLSTPAGDTSAYGGDDPRNDGVVLAQPTANPPVPFSNPSIEFLDVENPPAQDGGDRNPTDAPTVQSFFLFNLRTMYLSALVVFWAFICKQFYFYSQYFAPVAFFC